MTSAADDVSIRPAPDPRVSGLLRQLPAGRRAVLMAIKRRGQGTVHELAEDVGVTPSAIRQHLDALRTAGLVEHESSVVGRGRPRHHHRLTSSAQALFPRSYGELTTEL